MLTNAQADASYQQAFAALHSLVIDPRATPEQKSMAREKRDLLTLDFIGQAIASVEERTKKFRAFIDEMNALIVEFGTNSLLDGLRNLQAIVDTAAGLISAAQPAGAAGKTAKKTARKATRKLAKKPARKVAKKAAKKPTRKPAVKVARRGAAAVKPKKTTKKPAKAARKSGKAAKSVARRPARKAKRSVR